MALFRYHKGKVLLVIAAASLIIFIVRPFLLGGRSSIESEFIPVNEQMQVLIAQMESDPTTKPGAKPSKAPVVKPTAKPALSLEPEPEAKGKLDLNAATLEQLKGLPGIGDSKAQAILDYRLQKGRFNHVDELVEVKGIGVKMLAKLQPLLYVSSP